MCKFVKLHYMKTGREVYINIDKIIQILVNEYMEYDNKEGFQVAKPHMNTAFIYLTGYTEPIIVKEPIEEVLKLIEDVK